MILPLRYSGTGYILPGTRSQYQSSHPSVSLFGNSGRTAEEQVTTHVKEGARQTGRSGPKSMQTPSRVETIYFHYMYILFCENRRTGFL